MGFLYSFVRTLGDLSGICGSPVDDGIDYLDALRTSIERCLIVPINLQDGAKCEIRVSQTTQGVVKEVKIMECTGHPKLGEFVERAVLKASPLPRPGKESSLSPEFSITFKPDIKKIREHALTNRIELNELKISSPLPVMSAPAFAYHESVVGAIWRQLPYTPSVAEQLCSGRITQDNNGNVQHLEILQCDSNELAALVHAAVLKASPLPLPSDPKLFRGKLKFSLAAPASE